MGAGTIVAIFVLALGLGAALAFLWVRTRPQPDETNPLQDTLARIEAQMREFQSQTRDFEAQRNQSQGGIESQLSQLSRETMALAQAMRGSNTRGRWGELTLRRVAELAGMAEHCDFEEQRSEGGRRPDMLVRLPGGRTLAVDAKAPLTAYLDAERAVDAAARALCLDRHAQMLARHAADLAGREYWSQFATEPEMVVLFLPGEHFLSAALERRGELLEQTLAKRVLIATPVTLVSVLRGAAFGWRQERLAKNAEELRRIAGEFHERVRLYAESYAETGRQLARTVEAYNKSVGSWDARLQPSLRRMRELGVGGTAEIADLPHIGAGVREPHAGDQARPRPGGELPQ